MPTYVTLANFTADGLENIGQLPAQIEQVEEMKRALGASRSGSS